MKIKGLIFDLDGVLVSTEKNHFTAWKKTAERLGSDFTELDNEQLKGISRVDSLKKIITLAGATVSTEYFEELLVFKNEIYLDSIRTLGPADALPGVVELLQHAKAHDIKLGVGSSSKNANAILELLQIKDLFDAIIDGNGVSAPKPNPEVFLNAARAMGLTAAECIVFEDAESGIMAAIAGGFKVIATGNPHVAELAHTYLDTLIDFNLNTYEESF
jgi:beta-phosphoglucomutase